MVKKKVSFRKYAEAHNEKKVPVTKVPVNVLEFNLDPQVRKGDGTPDTVIWASKCGRYRVCWNGEAFVAMHERKAYRKVVGPDGVKLLPEPEVYTIWDWVKLDSSMGGANYPARWKTIRGAAEACLTHSGKTESNIDSLVSHAEKEGRSIATGDFGKGGDEIRRNGRGIKGALGKVINVEMKKKTATEEEKAPNSAGKDRGEPGGLYDTEKDGIQPTPNDGSFSLTQRETVMKILRSEVIELCADVGYKGAATWDDAKLASKLKSIDKAVDEDNQPKTDEGKALLKKLLHAIASGEEFEIVNDGKKTSKGETTVNKSTKPADAKKSGKAEKTKTEKKDKAALDRFGMGTGTGRANVRAVVSKKPQTIEQITEKSGEPKARVRNVLADLDKRGLVTKTEDGKYAMKG